MKKSIVFGILSFLLLSAFAKKEPQAWKKEKQLESQYVALKGNVSFWDGYFMFKEAQLNEFHQAIMDTIGGLEKSIISGNTEVVKLNKEIVVLSNQLSSSQKNLEESLSKESGLVTLGMQFDKKSFPPLMYGIIILHYIRSYCYTLYSRA